MTVSDLPASPPAEWVEKAEPSVRVLARADRHWRPRQRSVMLRLPSLRCGLTCWLWHSAARPGCGRESRAVVSSGRTLPSRRRDATVWSGMPISQPATSADCVTRI